VTSIGGGSSTPLNDRTTPLKKTTASNLSVSTSAAAARRLSDSAGYLAHQDSGIPKIQKSMP